MSRPFGWRRHHRCCRMKSFDRDRHSVPHSDPCPLQRQRPDPHHRLHPDDDVPEPIPTRPPHVPTLIDSRQRVPVALHASLTLLRESNADKSLTTLRQWGPRLLGGLSLDR